jgi:hypothetical protein
MGADRVRETFQRFAETEALGVSETYREWAEGVAADDLLPGLIAGLPAPKRLPTLFFAAARHGGAPVGAFA